MQYSHTTRATSPGPGPIVRWPTSGAPLGSQSLSVVAALSRRALAPYSFGRRAAAARIAVLVGGGRVEVGGWSPEAGQWAVEGRATGAGWGKAPALPLGGGLYDRSLGVGVPPDSPPKPVSFGFCFSGNTGGGFLYICCESIFF